jgi:hypothetical protein
MMSDEYGNELPVVMVQAVPFSAYGVIVTVLPSVLTVTCVDVERLDPYVLSPPYRAVTLYVPPGRSFSDAVYVPPLNVANAAGPFNEPSPY